MLKGIDARVTAELMDVLIRLGHGDEIVVADVNFPAHSTAAASLSGQMIDLPGLDAPGAIGLILTLLPLDGFTGTSALWMEKDGAGQSPEPVHRAAINVMTPHLPPGGAIQPIERQEFYARAKQSFAVIRCTETRPYGCFILRTGVVF